MASDRSPNAALAEMASHPRGDDLARLVHLVAMTAADERRAPRPESTTEAAARLGLSREETETSWGNVLVLLERGGADGASRTLTGALLARGVALAPPEGGDAEDRVAEALLWLAAHTPWDALPALDAALGPRAAGLWQALGDLLRRLDAGGAPHLHRAEAILSAMALGSSPSPVARGLARRLAEEVLDPALARLLGSNAGAPASRNGAALVGELAPAPRGPLATLLLGATGWLLLRHLARLAARAALAFRRPAELRITGSEVLVVSRVELLGRVVRERTVHLPAAGLSRVSRDVRYPALGMYAGLAALALGSYAGASALLDGLRAASPSLLGIGCLLLLGGVAADFALFSLLPGRRGRCRVVLLPRRGPAICVAGLDPAEADRALGALVAPAAATSEPPTAPPVDAVATATSPAAPLSQGDR